MTPRLFAITPTNPATLFNPFMLWTDLAMKTTEMLVASGQVIGNRVDQIARAGPNPGPRARKEFALMGSEKVKAATESALAMATRMQTTHYTLFARSWQQWLTNMGALAGLMLAGLAPVHRTATANARRLSRTRKTRTSRAKGA